MKKKLEWFKKFKKKMEIQYAFDRTTSVWEWVNSIKVGRIAFIKSFVIKASLFYKKNKKSVLNSK